MKISVITVCYNSEGYIEDAVKSVICQRYKDVEYIIVDGASCDNTLSIIDKYKDHIDLLISEPDKGIYDAMNKGIEAATGDYIAFLNSDDFYTSDDALSQVAKSLKKSKTDCIFGNINYVRTEEPSMIVRKWRTGEFVDGGFQLGWHPAHPTFIVKRDVYKKYGGFDLSFSLAADFELMLRFLVHYQISHVYLDKVIIHMRLGGATSSSLSNSIKQNKECYNAFKKNNIKVSVFYPLLRILPKLKQFF